MTMKGMSGKCLGKGQVECHCVGFPQGRNYSRGIGDAWYPSKTKVAANHQISPEAGKNCQKMKPKHFPLIPTMGNDSFLQGNEGNMEEIGERTQGWENLEERARLSAILWAFQGKNMEQLF